MFPQRMTNLCEFLILKDEKGSFTNTMPKRRVLTTHTKCCFTMQICSTNYLCEVKQSSSKFHGRPIVSLNFMNVALEPAKPRNTENARLADTLVMQTHAWQSELSKPPQTHNSAVIVHSKKMPNGLCETHSLRRKLRLPLPSTNSSAL